MADRYRSIVDVHVILERGDEILLLERQSTGYCDGMLHLPSGHLDEGEPAHHGAAREAREEVGVDIDPGDLVLATVVHHRQNTDLARVGFFFATTCWAGEPRNAEPHKCSKLQWCDPRVLPSNTIDYPATGIRAYLAGVPFTAHGWDHYSAGHAVRAQPTDPMGR
ncbi:MAG: NUDIX domain-containing protein [Nocardiopsaceae bacterium]|nr:NUDIX domain-containing protein [Nocardiopsaceae bacterium]